jgi:hypothetical protein
MERPERWGGGAMNLESNYPDITTDSSYLIKARYGETAGITIDVDTGFGVSFGVIPNPLVWVFPPDTLDLPPLPENEITPFCEAEITEILRMDSKTNSILADIWRDDVNDELTCS